MRKYDSELNHLRGNRRSFAIGTWKNYGGWGAGADRDPNTGKAVMFVRQEGKIKGVVKRDGVVQYG